LTAHPDCFTLKNKAILQRKSALRSPDPLYPDCVEKALTVIAKKGTKSVPGQKTLIAAFDL